MNISKLEIQEGDDTLRKDSESVLNDSFSNELDSTYDDEGGATESRESDEEGEASLPVKKPPKRSKMVYVIYFLAAIGFSVGTYFLLESSNEREFQSAFASYARETKDIANNNADNVFGQLKAFATAITSSALESMHVEGNHTGFPNVTIEHFDRRAKEISTLTGAEMILFIPFVEQNNRDSWEQYAVDNQWWIEQDYEYRGWDKSDAQPIPTEIYECTDCANDERRGFNDVDHFMEGIMRNQSYDTDGFSVPVAQYGPAVINSSLAMLDLFSHTIFKKEIVASMEYNVPVVSEVINLDFLLEHIELPQNFSKDMLRSFTLDPVYEDFYENSRTIGYVVGVVPWSSFFTKVLPEDVNGIDVVVTSDCESQFTYTVNGGYEDEAVEGDHHDPKYGELVVQSKFFWKEHPKGQSRHCHFDLFIYPTDEFYESYKSNDPWIFAVLVLLVFVFRSVFFFVYDMIVYKRQKQVYSENARVQAIVTSVFPKQVGLRLIEEAKQEESKKREVNSKYNQDHFMADQTGQQDEASGKRTKPIADLFPDTTVMFADIVGFTAWASMREPSQVFILLETIYEEFDALARKRHVFKIETIGDCYVAVCGLPKPQKNHFLIMSVFSTECVTKFNVLTQQLEMELGPDTAELGIRIGLHSGPVTAGVLRGERARFQLFGDTVNTASRIESTGSKNRIQISQATADLLIGRGKAHWFIPREEKVTAKGKGELQTYWLSNVRVGDCRSVVSSVSGGQSSGPPSLRDFGKQHSQEVGRNSENLLRKKVDRLIGWNVDAMINKLQMMDDQMKYAKKDSWDEIKQLEEQISLRVTESGNMVLDEVAEIVELPGFNADATDQQGTSNEMKFDVDGKVQSQLREYVKSIASLYNDNPFHNFEHASHVTMSVMKLLSRVVAPRDVISENAKNLHDHTYGITSDPLTQFAVIFAAMIHDVDHSGVPNMQLVREGTDLASKYKNKSVAEQNSFDIAWTMLMADNYRELRQAIYSTKAELKRFRQLVVNAILATDIMDKELKTLRDARWERAFADDYSEAPSDIQVANNRKATIVIEHLIQASDIAHTMQHWQVYRKWNACLFQEMYKAYQEGRSDKDPSVSWYEGEMGFFDFYVIPLAKKLESCGVFGVSSHEYLNYAELNRKEWELKGQAVVEELVHEAQGTAADMGTKGGEMGDKGPEGEEWV